MQHTLDRIEYLIDRQYEGARPLKSSSLETPWISTVDGNKITQNLDYARLRIASMVVKLDSPDPGVSLSERNQLKSQAQQLEKKLRLVEALLQESSDMQEEKLRTAVKRAEQVHQREREEAEELRKQNSQVSTDDSHLRNRLFGSQDNQINPDDNILDRQREMQDDLSEDLVKMSQALKMQAHRFHDKMQIDNEAVDSTSKSLDKSSDKMTKTGNRLDKYSSSTAITWKFYIMAFLFIMGAVLIALISSRIPRFM